MMIMMQKQTCLFQKYKSEKDRLAQRNCWRHHHFCNAGWFQQIVSQIKQAQIRRFYCNAFYCRNNIYELKTVDLTVQNAGEFVRIFLQAM